jgi:RNA polymerase sigma-70 factor (ECF subfamily)
MNDGQVASRWVDDHGECLYRYALVRVRKPEIVEDLVQETFLAAVRGYEKFAGRSSERSWLVGILKNKIVDHFRKLGRETSFTDMEFLSDEFSEKFVPVGFWNHDLGPHEWKPEPDTVMHRAEFWQVMRIACRSCRKKFARFSRCAKWMVCPARRFAPPCRSATAICG